MSILKSCESNLCRNVKMVPQKINHTINKTKTIKTSHEQFFRANIPILIPNLLFAFHVEYSQAPTKSNKNKITSTIKPAMSIWNSEQVLNSYMEFQSLVIVACCSPHLHSWLWDSWENAIWSRPATPWLVDGDLVPSLLPFLSRDISRVEFKMLSCVNTNMFLMKAVHKASNEDLGFSQFPLNFKKTHISLQ